MKAKHTAQISLFETEPVPQPPKQKQADEQLSNGPLPFEILVNGTWCQASQRLVKGTEVFAITGLSPKPLFVTYAERNTGDYFWTSVPEGNQALAQEIGSQIDLHLKK